MSTERMAIVTVGGMGGTYIGYLDSESPAREDGVVLLKGARVLQTITQPKQNPGGDVSITQSTQVLPMPAFDGPAEIYILPASIVFPDQDEEVLKRLTGILESVANMEVLAKAQSAGIVLPGRG